MLALALAPQVIDATYIALLKNKKHKETMLLENGKKKIGKTKVKFTLRLYSLSARRRSLSFKNFLRIRIVLGVTSTNSSSSINASARSSDMITGGVNKIFSSLPAARIFVNCFSFVALTTKSFSRVCKHTIMPSYTSVCGFKNNVPRSCKFHNAKARVVPAQFDTNTPRCRALIFLVLTGP